MLTAEEEEKLMHKLVFSSLRHGHKLLKDALMAPAQNLLNNG